MIQLAEECLLFQTAGGESIPFSAEMISVEIVGDGAALFDDDFIKHAAAAVFHYFRDELERESVTVAEFTLALEKILRGFDLASNPPNADGETPRVINSDLLTLGRECADQGELFFFSRLRDELRAQLTLGPQTLCFRGLRACAKRLAGARRWTERCQKLHDQIVEFLRSCMTHDGENHHCSLVVK